MQDKTFREYKEEAENYLLKKDKDVDLIEIASGLQRTFPKKPEPRDYFCISYIYMDRSAFPMTERDLQDWGAKIKQAFKYVGDLLPKFQDNNRLYLLMMAERVPLQCDEIYRMSKKALDGISQDYPNKKSLLQIQYRAADKYYDGLLKKAENSKNFDNYLQNIRGYDKAFSVLLDTSPSSRYDKYKVFRAKLKNVYMQSEWGKGEWGYKEKSMNGKVFRSLPKDIRIAMSKNINNGR